MIFKLILFIFCSLQSHRKSNVPVFNEQLDIPVTDGSEFLELTVKQFSMIRSVVIGRARIPLNEIAAAGEKGYIRTLTLLGESYNFSEKSLGEINIVATWVYDRVTEEKLKSANAGVSSSVFKAITKLFSKKKIRADDDVCSLLFMYMSRCALIITFLCRMNQVLALQL